MVINEPYNPAGTLMSSALQRELVDLADAHGIHILSDEVYRYLECADMHVAYMHVCMYVE